MYVAQIDKLNCILLGVFRAPRTPDDVELFATTVKQVDAAAQAQPKGAIFVVVPEPDYPSPNSHERHRFVALKDSCVAPSLFILVTRSALLRGVITAWLRPNGQRAVVCDSFVEAIVQTRLYRPDAVLPLQRMSRALSGASPTPLGVVALRFGAPGRS
jgi:hypothetical protein